jgi:hypothetical protein
MPTLQFSKRLFSHRQALNKTKMMRTKAGLSNENRTNMVRIVLAC